MKYEVQEYCLFGGWTNTWSDDDGPTTFDTEDEARAELKEFLGDMQEAVDGGDMEDCPDRESFRVVEVKS